jgi:hypothetical protein
MKCPTCGDARVSAVVQQIEADLRGRRGLKAEWEAIDEETKVEIREQWSRIIVSVFVSRRWCPVCRF